jgi:hypothetical protein
MSRVEKRNNAAGPIAATKTKRPNYPFLVTDVDQSVTMKLPASLSSDPYRHRIGTRYFLHRNPHQHEIAYYNPAYRTHGQPRAPWFGCRAARINMRKLGISITKKNLAAYGLRSNNPVVSMLGAERPS